VSADDALVLYLRSIDATLARLAATAEQLVAAVDELCTRRAAGTPAEKGGA
jgi:hypothetical protein